MTEQYKGVTIDTGGDPPEINRVLRSLVDGMEDMIAADNAKSAGGVKSGSTSLGGHLGFAHGLPGTPSRVQITELYSSGSVMETVRASIVLDSVTSTEIIVRAWRHDGATVDPLTSNPITFYWEARL